MTELVLLVLLVAVVLGGACVGAFVWLRGDARRAQRSAPEIAAVEDEDLDALAERLVSLVMVASGADGVSLRRRQDDGVTELAAVGRPIAIRDVWIDEARETKRTIQLGRILLVPLEGAGDVAATLVVDATLDARGRARVQALAMQARVLLEAALQRPNRATQRLLALAQSADLDQVFEALPDGIAVTDDRGEIIRVNAAGRAILEAASRGGPHNPLREALRDGMPTEGMEVAFGGEDGGSVVELKVSRLSRASESRAAVAILRDITRARVLEHQLQAESSARARHVAELEAKQKELEAATRHKSEFLANMSHELRTPLNGIIGFTEILLEGTYGALSAKQAECMRDVLDGGRHLLALINDILDVAKIEAGRVELSREDLPLDAIVANALTLVRPQAAKKRLELTVDVPTGLGVHGDGDRLRQVLLNLLSNAVKFTPASGSVRIEARGNERSVRIAVVDTGVGIAAEDQQKLFKEFSQVDGSITRRFGGTGLGLVICKRLIELHGGTIGVESTPTVGSRFWFEVPRARRTERPPFGVRSPLRSSSVPRLRAVSGEQATLVVDAHGPSRRVVARSLAQSGIAVTPCETLEQARAALENGVPAAIVIDPELGDATQAEAIELAVSAAGSSVVFTSAQSRSALALPEGTGFVQKPVDRALLVDEVSRAIGRDRRRERVALVIDDHEHGAAVVGLLQAEGMRVEHATTCAAARELFGRLSPELVVLELDLEDGDGLELLRGFAGRPRLVSVVLTNRSLDEGASAEVERLATIVARKGELSRTAFVRRIEAAFLPSTRGRGRVLAVDDNDQNLRLITALLTARGYDVIEARDATSAIEFARAERPDLVLMDVMLPGVDGLTATRTLAEDPRTRSIPVIAISANAMPEDHQKARDAGCSAYVTKPIDVRVLLETVGTALRAASCGERPVTA